MEGFYNYSAIILERKAKLEMLTVVARTLGLKNPYTEKHSENMIRYAVETARKLNLSDSFIESVKYGTLLHDIGKLAVPDNILNKPGRLDAEEFEEIKKHPVAGYELLKSVFEPISLIVRDHHEKVDGSGYLNGLKGDEIGLPAKIVAVADVFDALVNERPYKKAFSKEEAIKIIKEGAGTHFDEEVVSAFLEVAAT